MAKKSRSFFPNSMAWFGALLILFAALQSSIGSIYLAIEGQREGAIPPVYFGYSLLFGWVGILVLAISYGFIDKPRYYGTSLIIIGVLNILSSIGLFLVGAESDLSYEHFTYYVIDPHLSLMGLMVSLPGLLAIIEGIVIKRPRKKKL